MIINDHCNYNNNNNNNTFFSDRKSTRLNSSHGYISYAVFCLKKKKTNLKRKQQTTHYITELKTDTCDSIRERVDRVVHLQYFHCQ